MLLCKSLCVKRREQKRDLGITSWPISQCYNVRDEDPRRTVCPIRAAVTGAVLLNRCD